MKLPVVGLFLLIVFGATAQGTRGLPFVTNFSPAVYNQGPQNFAAIQDNNGILYFGNNNGVLMYDGVSWELIAVNNKSEVHSLAAEDDRIYVGAQGEFGYLEKGIYGKPRYVSLLPLLDSAHRNFNDVWSVHITEKNVVFRSPLGLYLYDKAASKVSVIDLPTTSHRSFLVSQEVWIRERGMGLMRLVNNKLESIPGGEMFAEESINSAFALSANNVLLGSEQRGLIRYDGVSFTPIASPANDLLKSQNHFGFKLPNSTFAIGTRQHGMMVIDSTGAILHRIGKREGLQDESIWGITYDRYTRNVWLASNNGISVVELGSPFTSFQERSGLNGQYYSVTAYKDFVYCAGSLGVYRKPIFGDPKFSLVPGLELQSWHLYSDSTSLLVSTNFGVYQIENGQATNIGLTDRSWYMQPLSAFPGYILVNTVRGIVLIRKVKDRWQVARTLNVTFGPVYYFADAKDGDIWLNSPTRGVYRLRFQQGIDQDPVVDFFDKSHGLPSNFRIRPFEADSSVLFASEYGLYRFNRATEKFELHVSLNQTLFGSALPAIEVLREDRFGNLWGSYYIQRENTRTRIGFFAEKDSSGYRVDTDIFRRINSSKCNEIFAIDHKNVFVATADGLIHYNPPPYQTDKSLPVLIRSFESTRHDSTLSFDIRHDLSYAFNSLRFRFAAMGFTSTSDIEYSTWLEGFDGNWSAATTLAQKEYTNLPPGTYTLRIRAKNLNSTLGESEPFTFTIAPPWYRTLVAYLLYVVGTGLAVFGVVQWRSNNLRLLNLRLERNIAERTSEIQRQNQDILEKNTQLENQKEEIEAQKEDIEAANKVIALQNENLKYMNSNLEKIVDSRTAELQQAYTNLLALKEELDTFTYRSSHDIKGPLMRLLGLCHVAKLDVSDKNALQYFRLLEEEVLTTNRILQKLIVYQHVKNRAASRAVTPVSPLLKKALKFAENLPGYANATIQMQVNPAIECTTDPFLTETAIANVIENAVLYAGSAKPVVEVSCQVNGNYLVVQVSDKGKGIEESIKSQLFDMFFRGTEHSKGAGLGLFIAREALNKVNGSIELVERAGWTTTFQLKIPMG